MKIHVVDRYTKLQYLALNYLWPIDDGTDEIADLLWVLDRLGLEIP